MRKANTPLKRLFSAGLIPLLAFVSCIGEDEFVPRPTAGENTDITFSIMLPGKGFPAPGTRALTEEQESDVQHIDILVFTEDGDYFYTARCSNLGAVQEGDCSNCHSKRVFTVTLPRGKFDLVFLANARDLTEGPFTGMTKTNVMNSLVVEGGDRWPSDGSLLFPMWGEKNGVVINDATDLTNAPVKMTRMVARVELQIVQPVEASRSSQPFQLTSVRVYNHNTKGSIAPMYKDNAPAEVQWNPLEVKVIAPNVPSSSTLSAGPLLYTGEEEIGPYGCERTIYIFEAENHADDAHTAQKALTDRTCLVVGGSYNGGGDTFYRIDFSKGSGGVQTYLDVLRNHSYLFKVTGVWGPGFATPEEAFNSAPVNMVAEVLEWNDGELSDIVFDATNYLSVKPSGLEMYFYKKGGTQQAAVRTDVAGWIIERITELAADGVEEIDITDGGWLTTSITGVSQSASPEVYFPFEVTADENPSSTSDRTGYIYIVAGRLHFRICVTQSTQKLVFEFDDYINGAHPEEPSSRLLPIYGGSITATPRTNIGWTLKTDMTGISATFADPESHTANFISLAVTIPRNFSWGIREIEVWLESAYYYGGQQYYPVTYRQDGYSLDYVSTTCPANESPDGGTYDMVFAGICPDFEVRTVLCENKEEVLWESETGNVGTRPVVIPPNFDGSDRTLCLQYKRNDVWITAKEVLQAGPVIITVDPTKTIYPLNGLIHSLGITSNVGWRVEIETDDRPILSGGLTNATGKGDGAFSFRMIDEINGARRIESGKATLVIYPEVAGMFPTVERTINGFLCFDAGIYQGSQYYFWYKDFTGSSWYVYANVLETVNEGGITTPDGTQMSPPREGSCANIDPENPKRWRLPTRTSTLNEMTVIANYVGNNGGYAKFGFTNNANLFTYVWYWGARSLENSPSKADFVGRWSWANQWSPTTDDNDSKTTITNRRARCIFRE